MTQSSCGKKIFLLEGFSEVYFHHVTPFTGGLIGINLIFALGDFLFGPSAALLARVLPQVPA